MENNSEVAALMAQIDRESSAARTALTAFRAGETRHAFITKRMEGAGQAAERLATLIGVDAAAPLIVAALEGTG